MLQAHWSHVTSVLMASIPGDLNTTTSRPGSRLSGSTCFMISWLVSLQTQQHRVGNKWGQENKWDKSPKLMPYQSEPTGSSTQNIPERNPGFNEIPGWPHLGSQRKTDVRHMGPWSKNAVMESWQCCCHWRIRSTVQRPNCSICSIVDLNSWATTAKNLFKKWYSEWIAQFHTSESWLHPGLQDWKSCTKQHIQLQRITHWSHDRYDSCWLSIPNRSG